jgi:hypothetical protein
MRNLLFQQSGLGKPLVYTRLKRVRTPKSAAAKIGIGNPRATAGKQQPDDFDSFKLDEKYYNEVRSMILIFALHFQSGSPYESEALKLDCACTSCRLG